MSRVTDRNHFDNVSSPPPEKPRERQGLEATESEKTDPVCLRAQKSACESTNTICQDKSHIKQTSKHFFICIKLQS